MHLNSSLRVLVVDDDEFVRAFIASFFSNNGFQVVTADGGRAAYEALKKAPFHLVVSDLEMPEGDGLELLCSIRSIFPCLPVFIVTGSSALAMKRAAALGANAVFTKPFDCSELLKQALAHSSGSATNLP